MESREKISPAWREFLDGGTSEYRVYVLQKIERGLEDIDAGLLLSEEEFDLKLARWLDGKAPEGGASL